MNIAQDRNPDEGKVIVPLKGNVRHRALKQHLKPYLNKQHMTTKSKSLSSKQIKNEKYRVIPKLAITGKQLMSRVKNRSINLTGGTQYSLDEKIDQARRMDKAELQNTAYKNQEEIKSIKSKLNPKP